uniref:Uncharacterized protein n=1 Tax=Anguilla anguilla TaxID=7936 RepID=A0A0E9T0R9_ANGAN
MTSVQGFTHPWAWSVGYNGPGPIRVHRQVQVGLVGVGRKLGGRGPFEPSGKPTR